MGQFFYKLSKIKSLYANLLSYFHFIGKLRSFVLISLAAANAIFAALNYIVLLPLIAIFSGQNSLQNTNLSRIYVYLGGLASPERLPLFFAVLTLAIYSIKFITGLAFAGLSGYYDEEYANYVRINLLNKFDLDHEQRRTPQKSNYYNLFALIPKLGSLNWAIVNFTIRAATAGFTFFSLLFIVPKLLLYSSVLLATWALLLVPLYRWTRQSSHRYMLVQKDFFRFLTEHLEGLDVIKVFILKAMRNEELDRLRAEIRNMNVAVSISRQIVYSAQENLIVIGLIACLFYYKKLGFDLGILFTYGFLFSKLMSTLNDASTYLNNGLEQLASVDEIHAAGLSKASSAIEKKVIPWIGDLSSIRVDQLTCRFDGKSYTQKMSDTFQLGDRVLLSGPNGAGKSTFAKMLLRLIHSEGTIYLNDNVWDESVIYAGLLSYCSQETFLFSGSLQENIIVNSGKSASDLGLLLAKLELKLEDIFDGGLRMQIKENGGNLSGGQKQIINILRALVRDYQILVLDEPTNHLSKENTERLEKYLSGLKGKIVFLISHRQAGFVNRTLMFQDTKS